MRTVILVLFVFVLTLQSSAQQNFYLTPNVGAVWNRYSNNNENIIGNEKLSGVFGDNDWIFGLLAGYEFENNIILETGFVYHNAANRVYLNYTDLKIVAGSTVSLGEGYYSIPLNFKYSIHTGIDKLNVIPYLGLSYSTHTVNSSPYLTNYHIIYSDEAPVLNSVPEDTTALIRAYRPSKNSLLINYGVAIEYRFFKNVFFTLSGNFTTGFSDMNMIEVYAYLDEGTEHGLIWYRGNKFYISGGLKFPF